MSRAAVVTTYLDAVGVALTSVFAFVIWPPLALLVLGAFALVASWQIQRGR